MTGTENHKLPKGWAWTSMDKVCVKIQDGTHFSPNNQLSQGRYKYVTAKNIRPWGLDLSDITYLNEMDHRVIYERCDPKKGDVLLVKDGVNTGDAAINTLDEEFSLLSSVCLLRPKTEVLFGPLLCYFLLCPIGHSQLTGQMTGTAIKRIILRRIKGISIPIAPLPEQHRIVAEIETQFTRLNVVVTALKRVQANLKRYRASILQAACAGRLVPTEAELARAEGRSYESADQLLQRILQERRAKWEAEQLANMKAAGKAPKDDAWESKYREPAKPDTSELPELPDGWTWATVEQLAQLVTDGDHNPPKRVPTGVPHLTAKHIKRWHITFDNCTYITLDDFERTRSRFEPLAGDLIITCVGTVGETAIVPDSTAFSADRNLAGIRLVSNGINSKMLQFVLSTPEWQIRIRQASGSTAQPHLYLGNLRALPVPMPPLSEQHRIVAEVERRLSVIDELEAVIATNLKRADRLRQAILKRAFEGKLVPQDPTDEPARVLLERIRMERERPMEKPKATPPQTNAPQPVGQPKATAPVQGELTLGFRG